MCKHIYIYICELVFMLYVYYSDPQYTLVLIYCNNLHINNREEYCRVHGYHMINEAYNAYI
jgi:hypothetical protein